MLSENTTKSSRDLTARRRFCLTRGSRGRVSFRVAQWPAEHEPPHIPTHVLLYVEHPLLDQVKRAVNWPRQGPCGRWVREVRFWGAPAVTGGLQRRPRPRELVKPCPVPWGCRSVRGVTAHCALSPANLDNLPRGRDSPGFGKEGGAGRQSRLGPSPCCGRWGRDAGWEPGHGFLRLGPRKMKNHGGF